MQPLRASLLAALLFITLLCGRAHAATYAINGDVAGSVIHYTVQQGDTLYGIARRYDLGIVEVMAANPGLDPWMPPPGLVLTLPTAHILPPVPRQGIVINLPEMRLYYFPDARTVMTFPIGIGKEGWRTPTGETKIVRKRKDPVWIPPESIHAETPGLPRVFPAGPDNPLGTHALNLGWPGVVIHGTNRPYGIGRRSSHGCIRLYPEDIPVLFSHVGIGTKVRVIDAPIKAGMYGNNLLLEVMPQQNQADEIIRHGSIMTPAHSDGIETIIRQAAPAGIHVDWNAANAALQLRNGIPALIGARGRMND